MKHLAQVSSVSALLGVNKKSFSRLALWALIFVFLITSIAPGIAFAQSQVSSPLERGETQEGGVSTNTPAVHAPADQEQGKANPPSDPGQGKPADPTLPPDDGGQVETLSRSEERRVGKECRSR